MCIAPVHLQSLLLVILLLLSLVTQTVHCQLDLDLMCLHADDKQDNSQALLAARSRGREADSFSSSECASELA